MIERVMPSISFIVARSFPGNVIGCENQLPWNVRSDLIRFRKITTGHAVIMGRKTFDSIGRILPNRKNIVLTKNEKSNSLIIDNDTVSFANNVTDGIYIADLFSLINNKDEFFVIGGAEVYKLYRDFFNKIYLTHIYHDVPNGDAHFNENFDRRKWDLIDEQSFEKSEHDEYKSRFFVYERKMKTIRVRDISELMTGRDYEKEAQKNWIENNRSFKIKNDEPIEPLQRLPL